MHSWAEILTRSAKTFDDTRLLSLTGLDSDTPALVANIANYLRSGGRRGPPPLQAQHAPGKHSDVPYTDGVLGNISSKVPKQKQMLTQLQLVDFICRNQHLCGKYRGAGSTRESLWIRFVSQFMRFLLPDVLFL